jgi:hypothetical protein
MTYICYKRFKGHAICGDVNIPHGTIVTEQDGMLYWKDKPLCLITSENAWEHFHPNTVEGAYRQKMLERLYNYYGGKGASKAASDFDPDKWRGVDNLYWKNLLRTMKTEELVSYYKDRLGTPDIKEV